MNLKIFSQIQSSFVIQVFATKETTCCAAKADHQPSCPAMAWIRLLLHSPLHTWDMAAVTAGPVTAAVATLTHQDQASVLLHMIWAANDDPLTLPKKFSLPSSKTPRLGLPLDSQSLSLQPVIINPSSNG